MTETIGLMDSGMGGLSVLKYLINRKDVNILYMADTARLPYGKKGPEQVALFTEEAVGALVKRGADRVIIACNTASAYGLDAARKRFDLPIEGMIEGAAGAAVKESRTGRILIMATEGTVNSGSYEKIIHKYKADAKTEGLAADDLVIGIEAGHVDDAQAERLVKAALSKVKDREFDSLILACTHFPLAMPVFQRLFPADSKVKLIDPARYLSYGPIKEGGAQSKKEMQGKKPAIKFFVSGDPEAFREKSMRLIDFSPYEVSYEKLVLG